MGRKKKAYELTVEEFIGGFHGEEPETRQEEGFIWDEEEFLERVSAGQLEPYMVMVKDIYWHPYERMIYSVAVLKGSPRHAVLLAIDHNGGTKTIVGEFYRSGFGNVLGILEEHRGIGVGPHFVAAAVNVTDNLLPSPVYSPAGLITRRRAHQLLVEEALRIGKRVPKKVLTDYPELTS